MGIRVSVDCDYENRQYKVDHPYFLYNPILQRRGGYVETP